MLYPRPVRVDRYENVSKDPCHLPLAIPVRIHQGPLDRVLRVPPAMLAKHSLALRLAFFALILVLERELRRGPTPYTVKSVVQTVVDLGSRVYGRDASVSKTLGYVYDTHSIHSPSNGCDEVQS